jgi:hypothetical protein
MRKNIFVFGAVVLIAMVFLGSIVNGANNESTEDNDIETAVEPVLNINHLTILNEAVEFIENEDYKSVVLDIIDFIIDHGSIDTSQIQVILDSYELEGDPYIRCNMLSVESSGTLCSIPGFVRSNWIYFAKRACVVWWDAYYFGYGSEKINVQLKNLFIQADITTEHSGLAIGYIGAVHWSSLKGNPNTGEVWQDFSFIGNAWLVFTDKASTFSNSEYYETATTYPESQITSTEITASSTSTIDTPESSQDSIEGTTAANR